MLAFNLNKYSNDNATQHQINADQCIIFFLLIKNEAQDWIVSTVVKTQRVMYVVIPFDNGNIKQEHTSNKT